MRSLYSSWLIKCFIGEAGSDTALRGGRVGRNDDVRFKVVKLIGADVTVFCFFDFLRFFNRSPEMRAVISCSNRFDGFCFEFFNSDEVEFVNS